MQFARGCDTVVSSCEYLGHKAVLKQTTRGADSCLRERLVYEAAMFQEADTLQGTVLPKLLAYGDLADVRLLPACRELLQRRCFDQKHATVGPRHSHHTHSLTLPAARCSLTRARPRRWCDCCSTGTSLSTVSNGTGIVSVPCAARPFAGE